jgi:hypothetical protein
MAPAEAAESSEEELNEVAGGHLVPESNGQDMIAHVIGVQRSLTACDL